MEAGKQYQWVLADDRTVGLVSWFPLMHDLKLTAFYLKKSERGKGLSHAVMDVLLNEARRQGFTRILLDTSGCSDGTAAAYRHLGFREPAEQEKGIDPSCIPEGFKLEYIVD